MIGLLLAGVVASTACAPFLKVDETLKGVGERIVSIGRTDAGYVLTYATSDGKTWSIVSVDQEAKACFLADGQDYSLALVGKQI